MIKTLFTRCLVVLCGGALSLSAQSTAPAPNAVAWPRWPGCPADFDAVEAQAYTQQQLLLHFVPKLAGQGLADTLLLHGELELHFAASSDSLRGKWWAAPAPLQALVQALPTRGWSFPEHAFEHLRIHFERDPAQATLRVVLDTAAPAPICFRRVERIPSFPGGNAALFRFLAENLHWPREYLGEIGGTVVAQLTIEADGRISAAKIVRALHPQFDAEVLRVVALMPPWEPGISRWESISPVYFNLPVRVRLE